jgi:hypothetical protein
MSKIKYSEGGVFAVPLRSGGFARGVVTRTSKAGKILIGYFFGPKLSDFHGKHDSLAPQDSVAIMRCGDLGIITGDWPLIGTISDWNRDMWRSPKFLREDPISKRAWLITYADDDASLELGAEPCGLGLTGYESAGLAGSGVVEIKLTKMLD